MRLTLLMLTMDNVSRACALLAASLGCYCRATAVWNIVVLDQNASFDTAVEKSKVVGSAG